MRKRKYTLAVLTLLTAATIASGWVTRAAPLIGSLGADQTIAGSKGEIAGAGRDPLLFIPHIQRSAYVSV
jgi:hypothetical protein